MPLGHAPGKAAAPIASAPEDLSTPRRPTAAATVTTAASRPGPHGSKEQHMAQSPGVPARRPHARPAHVLAALPAWATTGVGSLPHTFPEPAATHAVGEYDVPFCPQLPRLEGDMVREWLGADPPRCGWAPERRRPAALRLGARARPRAPRRLGRLPRRRRPPAARARRRQAAGDRPGHAGPRARARRARRRAARARDRG